MDQFDKTIFVPKKSRNAVKEHFVGLENVPPISYKDQARFTSPWAVDIEDEETFEETLRLIGRLLGQDHQLQALYYMLLMVTPSAFSPQNVLVISIWSVKNNL